MEVAIITYLLIALFMYIFFKTQCDIRIVSEEEEIDRTVVEVALTIICLLWIITLPIAILNRKKEE